MIASTPSRVVYESLRGGMLDNHKYKRKRVAYPEVTISAFTETGQEESSIIVPLQRAYSGRIPVISSHLADTPCATLGIQGLLDQLNTTLRTSYNLDNPFLSSPLEDCITNNYDFGMAYGQEDRERRQKAIIDNRIVDTDLPPRRVWDLYSNRVVPWWIGKWPQPISHAWVDEKDRTVVRTPINRYEWPVPIPKDVDLNLIRIEMLNLGLEYTWLDILCLRQVGGQREDMRTEEWKLDVPTIGRVYAGSVNVVCYLSGLGRPLTLKEGDLESDRSWFRRAWTLQEVVDDRNRQIAGDTLHGPLHAEHKDGRYETELLTRFHKQLQSMHFMLSEVPEALEEMQKRVSTNPVDKIAGLSFVMNSQTIPVYYESESLEEAWTALVNSMHTMCRAQVFFLCPEPGNAGKKWRPSWDQVTVMLLPAYDFDPDITVDRNETLDKDLCDASYIEKGLVWGLAVVEEGDRHGVLIVKDKGGIEHGFDITATHTHPILEDTYTMIYTCKFEGSRRHGWVVGRSLPGGKFEKVSTVETSHEEQRRLEDLRITKKHRYILI
ncbi:hypothetical protein ARMSODRAFT_1011668 [Armillaria solidipes]|uniref:Heterokaryon incompatibility domain-containing protein n=1 Tax=Armillaria solidipes TaxID=1076256 RepID=A0A2H3CDI5_9AGAR|nr:hypothetical protein ARMSODRAFT_1011668 [Armillaria solidipes]